MAWLSENKRGFSTKIGVLKIRRAEHQQHFLHDCNDFFVKDSLLHQRALQDWIVPDTSTLEKSFEKMFWIYHKLKENGVESGI